MQRAGALPILVGGATEPASGARAQVAAGPTPAKVKITVADQSLAQQAGIHGVLFTAESADASSGPVSVSVDPSSFASAFGGDYASRLHLVQLPACALTTPQLAQCQTQTPLPAKAGSPLTAQVTLSQTGAPSAPGAPSAMAMAAPMTASPSGAMVLAATSGTSGSSGDYSATSLTPAGTWSMSGNTGAFAYTYPVPVPPAIGGAAPNVSLSYDSSSQDGRTAGTNNQSSWAGDGWGTPESFVERTYKSCGADSSSGAPQYSGDECWAGQLLTLSLGGQSTQIVYDDVTHTFHASSDSSTEKVEQLTGGTNGTYNGEYWRVTQNGVQYYFGMSQLPGYSSGKETTQSVYTVPVYGAHAGDPCNGSTFATSSCVQGYRWNLDYVVDLHSNATAYYYQPETNMYGADMQKTGVTYTRGGYLKRIDYGMTASTVYAGTAPEQIVFTTAERCLAGTPSGNTCADSQFTTANAAYWPDVPIDQNCTDSTNCTNHGPSYWSRKRLTSIQTQIQNNGTTQQVDKFTLNQSYPDGGDHAPTLWLDSIQRTGQDTSAGGQGTIVNPATSFDPPDQLPNRVGTISNISPMYHDRVSNITTETGAQVTVSYNTPTCTTSNTPSDPSTNTQPCYPVSWTPPGFLNPTIDWFQKYSVHSVWTQDLHNANQDGTMPELLTTYNYGPAAWHYDDNELVKDTNRTYGQFRGYQWVETRTGEAKNFHVRNGVNVYDQTTLAKSYYFQGMDGDTLPNSGTRSVTLTSQDSKYTAKDSNAFSGRTFETDTYTVDNGAVDHATVTLPTSIGPTASRARTGLPALTAQMVLTANSYTKQAVTGGSRNTETDSFYNTTLGQPTTGLPVQVADRGDITDPVNTAKCTWTKYLSNSGELLTLPAETVTRAQDCPSAGAAQSGTLISDQRTSYDGNAYTWDGASPAGTAPVKGEATLTEKASGVSGGSTVYTATAANSYDSYGRPASVVRTPNSKASNGSSLAETTTTGYSPAIGGVPTQVTVTKQVTAGATPTYQSATITYDPARNLPVEKVDAAGLKTDLTYDALGRTTAVWLPNESKAASQPANMLFTYAISATGPSVVTSKNLQDNGSYLVSETLYDALLRSRQTQSTAENSSMLVSDTQYDSHGWKVLSNDSYNVAGAPAAQLVSAAQANMPATTVTDYDGMGRADLVTQEHLGAQTSATVTALAGDRSTVVPPSGGVASTTFTNARGQRTELDQYTTAPQVSGSSQSGYTVAGGTISRTKYAFDGAGNQTQVTGPDNSVWQMQYDLFARKIQQTDADTGTTTYGFDDAGDQVSVTDSRGVELDSSYDLLGRKLASTDKSNSNFQFASWTYDTLQAGKLTSSTRYVPGTTGGYTVANTGYTSLGKSTGTKITLPSSEAPLPSTYTTSYSYSVNTQSMTGQTDQRVAGLLGEAISYGHDALGQPSTVSSALGTYVGGVVYSNFNEISQITFGPSTNPAWATYTRDDQTRRLTDVLTSRFQAPGPAVDDTSYAYDTAGNPTSTTDKQSDTGNTVTDTQCYQYDSLDRLSQAWTATGACPAAGVNPTGATIATGTAAYWQSFVYDAVGDRTSETDHAINGASGDTTTSYTNGCTGTCPNGPQPHTLTGTSTTGPTGTSTTAFTSNQIGATIGRTPSAGTGQTLHWDDEGRIDQVTQGSSVTKYLYDAEGNQLIRRDIGAGQTTLFAGDTEIVVNTSVTPNVLLGAVRTYSLGGQAVAVASNLPGGGLVYVLSDPHGTATLTMDSTTQKVARKQYTPYGQVRGTTSANWIDPTRGYLGKPVDAGTGYSDVGARKYDPMLGRFINADPMFEANDPQQLGGYNYAGGNPVAGSDPTGMMRNCLDTCTGSDRPVGCSGGPCHDDGSQGPNTPTEPTCGQFEHYNGHFCASDVPQPPGFGDPPSCPGSDMCRTADDPVVNQSGSIQATAADHHNWDLLNDEAQLSRLLDYQMASTLLDHYLNGKGETIGLTADSVDTLYTNVPQVQNAMKQVVEDGLKSSTAQGKPGFVSQWQNGDAGKVPVSKNPFESHALGKIDWYLSFADFDYRVSATRTAAGAVEFRYQIRKYYDFDSKFSTPLKDFSLSDLTRLHDSGLAQNYWIFGQSNTLTIP
ncbi:RHS repeat-associated core domain-containing protein [Kitasatospora nipponensis]